MTKSYCPPPTTYSLGAVPCDPFAAEAPEASTHVDPEGATRMKSAEQWHRLFSLPTPADTAN